MARRSRTLRRQALSRPAIVAAALAIADSEGVEKVSLRRLAAELGVTAMALYTHVHDKADLLNAMGNAVLEEIRFPPDVAGSWAEKLRAMLRTVYAAFSRHPAAPALIARPLVSPAAMSVTEKLLAILRDAGFSPAASVRVIQVLAGMILGPTILSASYGRFAGQSADLSALEWERYGSFIADLKLEDYPTLLSVIPQMLDWPTSAQQQEAAIELIVGGIEAMAVANQQNRLT